MTVLERLLDPGVIAIVRAKREAPLTDVAHALLAGGVTAIEATLTTPGALESIRSLPPEIRERMVVGAGTVLDAAAARQAISAGVRFVVTPVVRLDVVAVCRELRVPVACGAFTPTEALAAHEAGADFVKIFPADAVGPSYIKALLGPLPMLRIIPTGGVTPETCGAFLRAGSVALGAGSSLVSDEILASRDWAGLTARALAFVQAVRDSRVPHS
jgi:2-dehydro-3-deoxyphosphogluconate aldolase / (4S)-4-hydroxy-2-oxoglutarate aldolase